ncbi:3-oxoacyl-ACP reductase [Veronia nyctiphanis]|uniref:3-oxoacyl-ACP reductase n=1 Tax=Veronia nyctiphanis TaxID=1278244 RepID=A0A4Q0YT05_9GAMM|nr:3-oxoacyl-ACP reductase [Veronia nyctiphanis]RXJ72101.1 3-oxoacyl-ACP reductase [Veronia nyctiphanis]
MDGYMRFTYSPIGGKISKLLGLPVPPRLDRDYNFKPSQQDVIQIGTPNGERANGVLKSQLKSLGFAVSELNVSSAYGLIFDATSIKTLDDLKYLHSFFKPGMRTLRSCGRVLVIGRPPEECTSTDQRIAQRSLVGFVRSLGKELRKGGTAQLVQVSEGAEAGLTSTLSFFFSPRSAYVSAQTVRVLSAENVTDWENGSLAGKRALITGASRGIGKAIAERFASRGATVIGLDIPAAEGALTKLMKALCGEVVLANLAEPDAPQKVADALSEPVDIIVHNAGVTRDKSLAAMKNDAWDMTLAINLEAPVRLTEVLLDQGKINQNGRVVGVASISGIAGNKGQTNYATSKAGVIGFVDAFSNNPKMKDKAITINAVAPGFIETEMTAKIPFGVRQVGRRISSLQQGGLPEDVAETILWFADNASGPVNGNTVRVCGQSLLGA